MMSKRVPVTVLKSRFIALCDALGKRIAKDNSDVGAWSLDKDLGGYTVYQLGERGSHHHPFGHNRFTAYELEQTINFTLRAIQLDRLNGADSAQYWPDDKCHTSGQL